MRNVVVTGGSRGIGLAICETLVNSGFNVIAVARNRSAELAIAMAERSDSIDFVKWDLSDLGSLVDLAKTVKNLHGPVYGLVNNAGIGLSGILSTMPDAEIEQVVRLNVLSPIMLTKHFVKQMMATSAGRIINISSIVASTGYSGLSVYSASKASLVGFSRSLAREVGSLGITVNVVAPGFIDTEMTDDLNPKQREQIKRRSAMQRMAGVADVAAAVQFLISDQAANITATVMTVDAGATA
jgi:3-oxoacyl-[acyl-carrier protein] reductase